MDGRTDGLSDGWTGGRTDGLSEGWTDGLTDGRTNGLMDERTYGRKEIKPYLSIVFPLYTVCDIASLAPYYQTGCSMLAA